LMGTSSLRNSSFVHAVETPRSTLHSPQFVNCGPPRLASTSTRRRDKSYPKREKYPQSAVHIGGYLARSPMPINTMLVNVARSSTTAAAPWPWRDSLNSQFASHNLPRFPRPQIAIESLAARSTKKNNPWRTRPPGSRCTTCPDPVRVMSTVSIPCTSSIAASIWRVHRSKHLRVPICGTAILATSLQRTKVLRQIVHLRRIRGRPAGRSTSSAWRRETAWRRTPGRTPRVSRAESPSKFITRFPGHSVSPMS